MQFTTAQQQVIDHEHGPLLVVAGAGAGKTSTIVERIVTLIGKGVAPETILAVTFTNKAAQEMKERIATRINNDPRLSLPISPQASGEPMPFVATFHGLSVWLLRRFSKELGIRKFFTIADRDDALREIKRAIKALGLDPKQYAPATVLAAISRAKNEDISLENYRRSASGNPYKEKIAAIWERYQQELKKQEAFDFDDLLVAARDLLKSNSRAKEVVQGLWEYVHVDEYQDTNTIQFDLLHHILKPPYNICVVGDVDQSIYTWRSAKPENLLTFEKHFPNTTTVFLEHNYRSTATILAAADAVIVKNQKRLPKKLIATKKGGEKITLFQGMDAADEARFVVEQAQKQIDAGVHPSDIAVLYRANFQSRVLEEAFLHAGVPYQVLGVKFFERKEVKDVISYLKAALNPKSAGDIARIVATPPRGIGKQTLAAMLDERLETLTPAAQKKVAAFYELLGAIAKSAQERPLSETIAFIIKQSGLQDHLQKGSDDDKERLENLAELVNVAKKYDSLSAEEAVGHFLEDVALASEQDSLNKEVAGVKLMTIHAAKGLEFHTVFITGLEEGLFPHERLGDETVDEEEERRLMYVAITRAKHKLFLTHAFTRMRFGQAEINAPSSFLEDIPEDLLEPAQEGGTKNLPHNRGISLLDDIEF